MCKEKREKIKMNEKEVMRMDVMEIVDSFRKMLMGALIIVSPALITSLIVATTVGVIQAMTQVQEQSISFTVKLYILVAIVLWTGPWALDELLKLAKDFLESVIRMAG